MERGLLPENVCRPDGVLEPFEPEKITRSLFAVAARIGEGDPFLARELTEGVLHFLSVERVGMTTTADEIAETTEKIVRELGHPALARAYRERSTPVRIGKEAPPEKIWPNWLRPTESSARIRQQAANEALSDFSLSVVYPAELASAHREGLLRICGLASPFELAGITVSLPPNRIRELLQELGNLAGEFIAVDGPEYELASLPGESEQRTEQFLQDVALAATGSSIELILNLNISSPPLRLAEGTGPLFEVSAHDSRESRLAVAKRIACQSAAANLRIWWHEIDPMNSIPCPGPRLILDRPRSPIQLGPGLDRQTPASLVRVGVNLPRLVQMLGGPSVTSELFLKKLASLTRFAKTAGHAKQDFLRKHGRPELKQAFLLDRARLVLMPDRLEEVATMSELPPAEFVREILRTMKLAAEQDRPRTLPVRIETEE